MDESIFDSLGAEPFFTNALNSFNLSADEYDAVIRIRRGGWEFKKDETLHNLAKTTTNVGIQYLMVSEQDTIQLVLANPNLSPKVVALFLESIENLKPLTHSHHRIRTFALSAYRAVENLLKSSVVTAEIKLFVKVWAAFEYFEDDGGSLMQLRTYSSVLHNTLYLNSTEAKSMSMSIDTLLFIFGLIHKFPEDTVSELSDSLRDSIINARGEEIRAWVEVNMPDCVDLPLSWVYEVFDLHEFDKLADFSKIGEA